MRIVVDLNRCQAYAQCCFLAPEAFKLVGDEILMYDSQPDDKLNEKILRAAAACPVHAIYVERSKSRMRGQEEGWPVTEVYHGQ
ncbi:ferredoxin [Ktedonosporobacter rubrisoli]|uniref:Ferredoxin n=1 Tax=Ktedonosporobacter rubrisoli TaxID=2509675 RepID=A0A4P6JSW2_KTERU|nr:ferredoxin [Ktedonosporobacter rubrisoli]QBD78649.1 ferredoxin [Ktedonosporobacter rubrisoli]